MKSRFLLSVCLLCLPFIGNAQNAIKMVEADGYETILLLSSKPVMTIQEGDLIIKTIDDEISCEIGRGISFTFCEYDDAGVDSVSASAPIFKITQDYIEGRNLAAGSPVALYDMAGKTVMSSRADSMGDFNLPVAALPSGIYVISTNDKKFKFYKK